MNNYLLQLLKEVKTIIIPGLGALTVTNEQSGEIMFMPYLKYDDGTLAKHISEKEGMDINDAKNLIAKFVREVSAELDKGEKYNMYQFGTFLKEDGEVAFQQWSTETADDTTAPESATQPAPEIVPVEAPSTTINIESTDDTRQGDIAIEMESTTSEREMSTNEASEETNLEDDIITQTIEPVEVETANTVVTETTVENEFVAVDPTETESNTLKNEREIKQTESNFIVQPEIPVVVETPTKEDVVVEKTTNSKKVKEEKLKKSRRKTSIGAYIIWGILVLLLGAGTFVAMNFNSLKKDFPILRDLAGESEKSEDTTATKSLKADEPVNETETPAAPEPIPTEEIRQPEPVAVQEPAPVVQPKPVVTSKPVRKPKPVSSSTGTFGKIDTTIPYHIIAGSFSSQSNAKKLATSLRNKGMTEITIGEQNGMYRVSIKGFTSRDEAVSALSSLKSTVPNAWIYKWN